MRCFVTGATGQLGSALVRDLAANGHDVTALVLPGDPWAPPALEGLDVSQATGDVRAPASYRRDVCDWVFHLAANQSFYRRDHRLQWEINVEGVAHLLSWLAAHPPRRLVHVSSLAAVGLAERLETPMDEMTPFEASEHGLMYALSKQAGERLVLKAASRGLSAVVANPGTVLGPWDRGAHAWRMLRPLVRGWVRAVPPGGNSLVDARDVARGLVAMAAGARAGRRYLLTGHNLTYRHLAKRAGRIAGNTGPIVTLPRWFLTGLSVTVEPLADLVGIAPPIAHDEAVTGRSYLYFNASKAHRDLGFRARPLDDTLLDTLEWYAAAGFS